MTPRRFHGWIVLAAAACVLLTRLGAAPLWDDDEPKNAACSLAMFDTGDWVVPMYNGRLRIEKPPLVNWIQIAGMAFFGRTEWGVRIGSAVLTMGTCLLTWRIGLVLFSPQVGLMAGLAMATCLWTAVGGRASTPDAPLVFCTTLTLFLFARDAAASSSGGPSGVRLSRLTAVAIGAACGAAVLTKGPIGFLLPATACAAFAACRGARASGVTVRDLIRGLRPLVITATTLAVALPWYAWVADRTDGAWLRGFLFVHNAGRFAAPMEGHSGSLLYYPTVLAIGMFPWSIVFGLVLVHAVAVLRGSDAGNRRSMLLLGCWMAAWLGPLSLAATKLPGYIWPAYPALSVATAVFLDACIRRDVPWLDGIRRPRLSVETAMRLGWCFLAGGGLIIAIGLPVVTSRWAPGGEWLGLIGLVPMIGAAIAWRFSSSGRPGASILALVATACLLTTLMASVAAPCIGHRASPRILFATAMDTETSARALAAYPHPAPSLVFYAGGTVERLANATDVARHVASRDDARVVVDARFLDEITHAIPATHGVIARVDTISAGSLVLIGPVAPPKVVFHDGGL
ncbi:MAG: ArnT family glycosyltransferase [Planctomycetia bacterium]